MSFSLLPSPYTSAVSMKFTPRSTARLRAARDSSSSTAPQLEPMAQEPKLTSDTFMPVLPSSRYLIVPSRACDSIRASRIFDCFTSDFKRANGTTDRARARRRSLQFAGIWVIFHLGGSGNGLRNSAVPERRGDLREARPADEVPGAAHPKGRHGWVPQILQRAVPPLEGHDRRSEDLHSRRRAAQPRLQLPLPPGRRARAKAPTSTTRTATVTSTSSRRAGPRSSAATTPVVRAQVIDVLNRVGPSTGLFHEFELLLAKEVSRHVPSVEMFRMLGSGTEAVMAAIRVARLATGKTEGREDRRRLSRVERPARVQPQDPGHEEIRGARDPAGRDAPHPGSGAQRPRLSRTRPARQPPGRRHGLRAHRARGPGERDPAGGLRVQRRRAEALRPVRRPARLRRGRDRIPHRPGRRPRVTSGSGPISRASARSWPAATPRRAGSAEGET